MNIILILGPEFNFWALKAFYLFFFLLLYKILDRYITRPYWFWDLNSVFELLELIFKKITPKSVFFLVRYKILDEWIYHTTILILGPKFRFWALGDYFKIFYPQNCIFSCSIQKSLSMDMSHDHTDFGTQILFVGFGFLGYWVFGLLF
jgi:hypothetical protein